MPVSEILSGDGVAGDGITVRPAEVGDIPAVIRIDKGNTGLAKPEYWRETFERYGSRQGRFFLVADAEGAMHGFIIGEVRAWEFGSPPCGWIFAIGVDPEYRLKGIGTGLFESIINCFREAGIDNVRTILAVDDQLNLSFFRSQGMMGGPFIQLEIPVD